MPPMVLILAVSRMRSNCPEWSTVRPAESSAPRNNRYASSGVISSGATTVTFLLFAGIVPGSRNCLQVIDEIQAIRSPSSVSGFRFSFTIRLPGGNFLQVLKSLSPISWFAPVTVFAPGVPGAAPGVAGAAGDGAPGDGAPPRPRFPIAPGKAPGTLGVAAGGAGAGTPGGAGAPGETLTTLPSGPVTTAARSGLAPRRTATTAATLPRVRLVIGCCSPW